MPTMWTPRTERPRVYIHHLFLPKLFRVKEPEIGNALLGHPRFCRSGCTMPSFPQTTPMFDRKSPDASRGFSHFGSGGLSRGLSRNPA
jgi:hypothetical protein